MPPKKASARKTAAKRTTTKKASAKRGGARRSTTKKATAKRSTAKRTTAKKTTARKTTARKTTAKKGTARKAAARKTTAKKGTARKTAAKKSPARKATAKRATAKRSTTKRVTKKTAAKKTAAKKTAAKKTAAKKTAAKKTAAKKTITGASADAIELLTSDHREVEQLFTQLEAASPGSEVAKDVADKIVRELSVHAVIEEQILYPVTRREVGEDQTEHAIDEHQEVKELLAKVDGKPVDDPDVMATFRQIKSSVEEHVQEEENEMFPSLRQKVGQEKLQQMGAAMQRAKRLAPTHPHPNAPNRPPGNVVVGLAASVIDKIRDAARDVTKN